MRGARTRPAAEPELDPAGIDRQAPKAAVGKNAGADPIARLILARGYCKGPRVL
jgi:hypothetical protein